jgi:hypothetical protein
MENLMIRELRDWVADHFYDSSINWEYKTEKRSAEVDSY